MSKNKDQEHTGHVGTPSYIAYAKMGCRNAECYAAFRDYRERLFERKATGIFQDMRRAENKPQPATLEQLIECLRNDPELTGQIIKVLPGVIVTEPVPDDVQAKAEPVTEPVPAPNTPAAEKPLQLEAAPTEDELADQDRVLAYLRQFTYGDNVLDAALDLSFTMSFTQLPEDRVMAASKALRKAGRITVDAAGHAKVKDAA